ncbi:MAG: hypothetical protein R3C44_22555 [Chloroflexota bacterium]
MNNQLTKLFGLTVALLLLVIASSAVAAWEPTAPAAPSTTAWAEKVVAYQPGAGVGANFGNPEAALGEDDAVSGISGFVAMGNDLADQLAIAPSKPTDCNVYLILEYVNSRITDGPGDDIEVYEVDLAGVAEAIWVYVGNGDDDWRYAGKVEGGQVWVDLSGVAAPGETFNRVGLCDFPDGISSGSPYGGPDIDAVAALNAALIIIPDYVIRVKTPTVRVNDQVVPPGTDSPPLKAGDKITVENGARADMLPKCASLGETVFGSILNTLIGRTRHGDIFTEAIDAVPSNAECEALGGTRSSAVLEFTLTEGSVLVTEYPSTYDVRFSTPLAWVTADGASTYGLAHDPTAGESELTAFGQQLIITPVNPMPTPFPLGPAEQVTLTADSAGPVVDLDQTALPVVVRP